MAWLSIAVTAGEQFILAAFPHGGQHTARRNAARAVASDGVAASQRRAVAHAFAQGVSVPSLAQG
jgi:hypothetical protein